jgi:hypothetical protein
LTFNELYGVISQKIAFFITTAVRTLNPAISVMFMSDALQQSAVYFKSHPAATFYFITALLTVTEYGLLSSIRTIFLSLFSD